MPTAKKQASGSWKVHVYSHTDSSGKQHHKTFTAPTKKEAERKAAEWSAGLEVSDKSFDQAVTDYISLRRNTLSPRTVEDYERTQRLYLKPISKVRIEKLTNRQIQALVDGLSKKGLSPKTIANVHCLISAVLHQERPQFVLTTTMPQRTKPQLTIPTDADIKKLLERVKGTTLELPVMLAAFGSMREGEICALRTDNIDGNIVHVCENMVKKMEGKKTTWIIRHPKSTEGDRYVEVPQFVANLWANKKGRVVEINPNTLCKQFKALGFPFRFHDLRHYSASIQHALGIPDAYIMQRGGWSSDRILKEVYRHTMSDHTKQMTRIANDHFTKLLTQNLTQTSEKPRIYRVKRLPATGIEPFQTESRECPKMLDIPENKDISAIIKTDISAKN